jgi:hypothetical protein
MMAAPRHAKADRIRQNRQAKRRYEEHQRRHRPHVNWRARQQRDREVAARLVRKFFAADPPDLVVIDYRYWQLRRFGYDLLRDGIALDLAGHPCPPMQSQAWDWWTELHYEQRDKLARMRVTRVTRQ